MMDVPGWTGRAGYPSCEVCSGTGDDRVGSRERRTLHAGSAASAGSTATRPRRRAVVLLLAVPVVLVLLVGGILGGRVLLADPAFGDLRQRGTVEDSSWPRGSRAVPARLGADTLQWETQDGGEISVRVDRAERVHDEAADFVRGWEGVPLCTEMFIVELTAAYEGAGSFEPATELEVQRMAGPAEAHTAADGLDVLAEPLLDPEVRLEDGDSMTGTVYFRGEVNEDWSGHLVIGTDEGRPLHVNSALPAPTMASGCTGS